MDVLKGKKKDKGEKKLTSESTGTEESHEILKDGAFKPIQKDGEAANFIVENEQTIEPKKIKNKESHTSHSQEDDSLTDQNKDGKQGVKSNLPDAEASKKSPKLLSTKLNKEDNPEMTVESVSSDDSEEEHINIKKKQTVQASAIRTSIFTVLLLSLIQLA